MDDTQRTVRTADALAEMYRCGNPERNLYVGIEWERSGVYRDTLQPVQYLGDRGYLAVLHKLVEEAGWEILTKTGDMITELRRGETRITIEGDGRLELAGSPQEILHDLAREFRLHDNEVVEMGNIFNIAWLPVGLQPLHGNREITMVPKERYRIFQGIGDRELMESMTKRTNGATVNFSFTEDQNAVIKAQTAFRVLPVVGAMFASSPLEEGDLSDHLDLRRWCILNHAPERTGVPPAILDNDFSLRAWIEYYIRIPVVLIKTSAGEQRIHDHFTFADWMENGYEGRFPTADDFDQHVKTTWSDLRLRPSYLEYRPADSVPLKLSMGLAAFVKGLLFDSASWESVRRLTEDWTYDDVVALDKAAWTTGLRTEFRGKTLLTYAQELLTIANDALHRFARMDGQGNDETVYLAPLKEQIYIKERSPAEEIAELWKTEWGENADRIVEWCQKN